MEAASKSEASANFFQTAWCNIPGDRYLHTCHYENLNTCFMVVWIFRVECHTALKGNGVVVFISLTSEHDVMFCEKVAVQGVNAEVGGWERTFLHWWEQQLWFADGHGVCRACRILFSLVTVTEHNKIHKFAEITCLFPDVNIFQCLPYNDRRSFIFWGIIKCN